MKTLRNIIAGILLAGVVAGVSACAPAVIPEPDHKAKTTACLIRSSKVVPGTPEKQIAADLVEAKIVYGLAVREITIDQSKEQVPARLLQALQAGCVLMVSANTEYLSDLAQFAKEHPRMLVLFVGGNIASSEQPVNFRWVADDLAGAARLAGFFAAGQSISAEVHLFIQPVYTQAKEIQTSFIKGVKDFDSVSGASTKTVFTRAASAKILSTKLESLDANHVAVIFGGKSIWQGIEPEAENGPYLIGADLLLGDTQLGFESRVGASVERNTSKYVLNAARSLLDREFASEPLYRKPGALKFSTVELRIREPESVRSDLLEALNQELTSLVTR